MLTILQRALRRIRQRHYNRGQAPINRPTERRAKAAEALKRMHPGHPDYSLLKDYVDGTKLDVIALEHHTSPSTVNRTINRYAQG